MSDAAILRTHAAIHADDQRRLLVRALILIVVLSPFAGVGLATIAASLWRF